MQMISLKIYLNIHTLAFKQFPHNASQQNLNWIFYFHSHCNHFLGLWRQWKIPSHFQKATRRIIIPQNSYAIFEIGVILSFAAQIMLKYSHKWHDKFLRSFAEKVFKCKWKIDFLTLLSESNFFCKNNFMQ